MLALLVPAIVGCGAGARTESGVRTACVPGGAAGHGSTDCGSGVPRGADAPMGGDTPARGAAQATARSGDLTVRLEAAPALAKRAGAVQIEVDARALRASGVLGYLLRYGDGTTSGSGAVPQFCLSGAGRPARRTWRVTHRYLARGRYVVSASVYINCTDEHATATVPVLVR